MDQPDVDLHKEVEAREHAALGEPGLGFHGPGDGVPYIPLLLGEHAPAFGDRGENLAGPDLGRAAGVERDEGGVADLPVAGALPDHIPALARLCIGDFHN